MMAWGLNLSVVPSLFHIRYSSATGRTENPTDPW